MSRRSQILRALRIGLVAMCATAVYEATKLMFIPRMSLVTSNIITIFFAGWVGFCISFIIRQRERAAQEELLRLATIVQQSDDAIISADLDGIVNSWNRGAGRSGFTAIPLPKLWAATFRFVIRQRGGRRFRLFCKRSQMAKP